MPKASDLLAAGRAASEPMVVYTGPKKTGTALIAAVAVDEQKQTTRPRGKKSRVAAKKPDAAAEPKAEAQARSQASQIRTKPRQAGRARHANAKPAAAPKPAKPAAAPKAEKPAHQACRQARRCQAGQAQGCCQARARRSSRAKPSRARRPPPHRKS